MAYTTIDKPSDYFNTVLYTGNGGTHYYRSGFQPDWIFFKTKKSKWRTWISGVMAYTTIDDPSAYFQTKIYLYWKLESD